MTQIKSLMVLFFAVLLLNGCANFHDNPVLPSHMISNGSNTDPIVFFVHGAGDGNEHNAIPGINTTFIQFQYDYLDGTDTNSEELLKAFIEFREGHPNNTIIIVAHSYGCCVVVAAIQKDDGDNFKNTTIVLLSPVIFGVEGALNKSEPFYQFWMWMISPIKDFRNIAISEDPNGPIIPKLISKFSLFERRVKHVSIFFEEGDEFIPNEKSPEIIKSNFHVIRAHAVELPRNGDKDPHTDILIRREVADKIKKLLFSEDQKLLSQN